MTDGEPDFWVTVASEDEVRALRNEVAAHHAWLGILTGFTFLLAIAFCVYMLAAR